MVYLLNMVDLSMSMLVITIDGSRSMVFSGTKTWNVAAE
jgi:hypothetical protein